MLRADDQVECSMASDVSPAKQLISVTRVVDVRALRFSKLQDITSNENSLNARTFHALRGSVAEDGDLTFISKRSDIGTVSFENADSIIAVGRNSVLYFEELITILSRTANASDQSTVRDSYVLQNRCFRRSFQGTIKK